MLAVDLPAARPDDPCPDPPEICPRPPPPVSPLTSPSPPPFDQAPKTDAPAVAAEPKVVTTELIQKYLDENQQLILAILENQNVGKLQECAQYQARLQQNLMYLAAIADAAPAQAKQQ
jgi:hypothetical protein